LYHSAGAFVQGSSVLSWVANNTAKLGLQHPEPYPQMQCWTLISTNTYGQANKVRLHTGFEPNNLFNLSCSMLTVGLTMESSQLLEAPAA
jgi:hypothetical protein